MFCSCCWKAKKYLTIMDIVKMPEDSYYKKAANLMMQQLEDRQKLVDDFMTDMPDFSVGLPSASMLAMRSIGGRRNG